MYFDLIYYAKTTMVAHKKYIELPKEDIEEWVADVGGDERDPVGEGNPEQLALRHTNILACV